MELTHALPTAEDTRNFARELATHLRPGDLILLVGELGAGKTTFTQGLGEGLGVRGPIASPTYAISLVHPSLTNGPDLIHVDAYRLGDHAELDDLDLDADMDTSVTVIEWGAGIAEGLSSDYLIIELNRAVGATNLYAEHTDLDPRTIHIHPVGTRWTTTQIFERSTD
ncbi:tRNA (adenosine(37)-N6)-threonylcarbamoyltransferase complex ATPase subunit type 1 TsaE [Dermatophilus congolensis]|uniref:tRNA (adenosine(37)-N6)-threonylcarbamoyltransferase complex ATPase subunit type 1 TsaE n=1 Tax=Dermatophilus congolensis TaxID=1863 RepID=UPI001AAF33B1|nr:tRNA (adenosine(37)-N6)-threonylcarbamoyltransferase complex ATPase subunit type 1 TsaE [Dermatophilus congolensis]MBO3143256.1 tRNA (adenosine(37)-N6)-threonylcarbamoyltransferase complex ATPase subunit type 1 TsaE [Dermatophilus congolensis]MBO3152241.1 tRNA (adenosine(37)-N6)-threonylcarbamoyltransferase complex ATPase subunit type 1 TsaE [Dermatophilus congolensis]MBO3160747.1 tRNA (adenosine(37)-N6)-threonylcarbamoyltransferase complex ATPase subunit type 1 TsaE [Dermatophilus congolensi